MAAYFEASAAAGCVAPAWPLAPPNSVSWTEEADVVAEAEAEAGVCGGAIAGSAAGYS